MCKFWTLEVQISIQSNISAKSNSDENTRLVRSKKSSLLFDWLPQSQLMSNIAGRTLYSWKKRLKKYCLPAPYWWVFILYESLKYGESFAAKWSNRYWRTYLEVLFQGVGISFKTSRVIYVPNSVMVNGLRIDLQVVES